MSYLNSYATIKGGTLGRNSPALRYLMKKLRQEILMRKYCDPHLYGWYDLDWARYPMTRHSLTVWFISLRDSPIS